MGQKKIDELSSLRQLVKEQKTEEAVALCAKVFGATKSNVLKIASSMSQFGFCELAEAIARTLDAPESSRSTQALSIPMVIAQEFILDPENPNRKILEKAARSLARLISEPGAHLS